MRRFVTFTLLDRYNNENVMGRAYSTHGDEQECIYDFHRKPQIKRPLQRPGRRRSDDIKMDLTEIGWDAMGRIDLPSGCGPVKGSYEQGNESLSSIICR
jgi:hypothetical protein